MGADFFINIAAYCRVSTDKEYQLNSLEAQKAFFAEYTTRTGDTLLSRNTVVSLQNVRKLKSLGIEIQFLTANMTSMGNSEFVLTIFGALAQEESATHPNV